jgi:hypothetical protein
MKGAMALNPLIPPIVSKREAQLLSPDVRKALSEYQWRRSFHLFECLMKDDDHGIKGADPPIIQHIRNSSRTVVHYGNEFNGSYNHHNQIGKFKGKYYFAWSNGARNEEDAGQRILVSSSADGRVWSEPSIVADVKPGEQWAHNCVAVHADAKVLSIIVMTEETEHDEAATGMRRVKPEDAFIDVYQSIDGEMFEKASSYGKGIKWLFEAPRPTLQGHMMCICTTKRDGPAALIWKGADIREMPEIVKIPEPEGAWFPYGESTWYQLDSGLITAFWRDEEASCRLYWNYSEDGGFTWSKPMLSDIPNSMSRVYAGRLSDGRHYLVGNAIPILLDRRPLMLLLSDDGITFSKVRIINDDPTEMRRKGLLKSNGHQYPCCLADGEKLLVAYDSNKEDIICEVIDAASL